MSIYAISDLHLSSDKKKSMEVFGDKWADYMNRIRINWENCIRDNDTVIIPGDVSWAMYLDESLEDFKYIDNLPGKKVILKGNHDYWWTTTNKMNEYIKQNGFNNIFFIHNNSFCIENIAICGSRGWITPEDQDFTKEDLKIFNRELNRLEFSLKSNLNNASKIIVAMHYPPFAKNGLVNKDLEELLLKYNVDTFIYGHLHGVSKDVIFEGIKNGVEYKMVSADYLNFIPYKIY